MQADIQEDFLAISTSYLEARSHLLRPAAPIVFVSEFLARWVSSTVHGFAMHSPRALADNRLAEELIDAVSRYLLKDGLP